MKQDEAELWIVNLIRNARLDAKIDSEKHHVIMGSTKPTVYQQVHMLIPQWICLYAYTYILASMEVAYMHIHTYLHL